MSTKKITNSGLLNLSALIRQAKKKHQCRQRLEGGLRSELGSASQVRQQGREV